MSEENATNANEEVQGLDVENVPGPAEEKPKEKWLNVTSILDELSEGMSIGQMLSPANFSLHEAMVKKHFSLPISHSRFHSRKKKITAKRK